MKVRNLNPKQLVPDIYRAQVIEKIDTLNERFDRIRAKYKSFDKENYESIYEKKLKWIRGNYIFTDVLVCELIKDVKKIKELEYAIEFCEFVERPELIFDKKEINE